MLAQIIQRTNEEDARSWRSRRHLALALIRILAGYLRSPSCICHHVGNWLFSTPLLCLVRLPSDAFRSVRKAAGRIGAQSRPPPRLQSGPWEHEPDLIARDEKAPAPMVDRRPRLLRPATSSPGPAARPLCPSRGISFHRPLTRRAILCISRAASSSARSTTSRRSGLKLFTLGDLGPLVHGPRAKTDLHQGDFLQEPGPIGGRVSFLMAL